MAKPWKFFCFCLFTIWFLGKGTWRYKIPPTIQSYRYKTEVSSKQLAIAPWLLSSGWSGLRDFANHVCKRNSFCVLLNHGVPWSVQMSNKRNQPCQRSDKSKGWFGSKVDKMYLATSCTDFLHVDNCCRSFWKYYLLNEACYPSAPCEFLNTSRSVVVTHLFTVLFHGVRKHTNACKETQTVCNDDYTPLCLLITHLKICLNAP